MASGDAVAQDLKAEDSEEHRGPHTLILKIEILLCRIWTRAWCVLQLAFEHCDNVTSLGIEYSQLGSYKQGKKI